MNDMESKDIFKKKFKKYKKTYYQLNIGNCRKKNLYSLFLLSIRPRNSNPLIADGVYVQSTLPIHDGERRDINTELHVRKPRQIYTSNSRTGSPVSYPGPFPVPVPNPPSINKPLDPQEELMRSERINRGFEKMLQFVTIAGQIDSYLSERAKAFIGRLSRLTEDDDSSNRLQSRRSKCR